MKKLKIISIAIIASLLSGSCATILNGTSQQIGVTSSPTNAKVFLNDNLQGTTPLVLSIKRKNKTHKVRIELEGFEPYEIFLTRKVSLAVLGNIICGGCIGLVVDLISGGIYRLTPESIDARLYKKIQEDMGIDLSREKDAIFVAVVLDVDPSWEKIGNLRKVTRERE